MVCTIFMGTQSKTVPEMFFQGLAREADQL